MHTSRPQHFVVAATVAAELYQAMKVARQIGLTASNARALAMRAGQSAKGFCSVTDFIDELAKFTVKASDTINGQAIAISRTATEIARAASALQRFDVVFKKAADSPHLSSLNNSYEQTLSHLNLLRCALAAQIQELTKELRELSRELRIAAVLAAVLRIEATQVDSKNEQALCVIAQSVADAAIDIQERVKYSQQLFDDLGMDYVNQAAV